MLEITPNVAACRFTDEFHRTFMEGWESRLDHSLRHGAALRVRERPGRQATESIQSTKTMVTGATAEPLLSGVFLAERVLTTDRSAG